MSDIACWPQRKPRGGDWTPEQTQALRDMAGCAPIADIAAATGRTPGAIYAHAAHIGLRMAGPTVGANHYRAWTPDDIGHLRILSRTHTRAEVAAILGRTLRSVIAQAGVQRISFVRYGERLERTRYSADTVQKIAKLEAQGVQPRRIAREFGVSLDYVYRISSRARRWHETLWIDAE